MKSFFFVLISVIHWIVAVVVRLLVLDCFFVNLPMSFNFGLIDDSFENLGQIRNSSFYFWLNEIIGEWSDSKFWTIFCLHDDREDRRIEAELSQCQRYQWQYVTRVKNVIHVEKISHHVFFILSINQCFLLFHLNQCKHVINMCAYVVCTTKNHT